MDNPETQATLLGTRSRMKTYNTIHTAQKIKKMSRMDPTKKNRDEPRCSWRVIFQQFKI